MLDVIFAFCMTFSDKPLCYERFANCVITKDTSTEKLVTNKKIAECKERLLNEKFDVSAE